jgi:hypothetical protein
LTTVIVTVLSPYFWSAGTAKCVEMMVCTSPAVF